MLIRSPIVATLGHVDHGKTTILDSVRGSKIADKEAGRITQMIGASYITKQIIEEVSKGGKLKFNLKIPGLLFIDTPGHEAFTKLRDRGGSIADIAILVVDVTQGFQPQTIESLKILKQYKTPFIIAANKIDLVHGWKSNKGQSFSESFSKQAEYAQQKLDEKLYELMGKISEYGFDSERFDRIQEFDKQIAIVPVSAKNKEGLSELLMLIAGLSQKFLEGKLTIDPDGRGRASVIEVKEEKGMGTTVDVIVYDGLLKKNDEIIYLTTDGVKTTKIRALLQPNLAGKEKFDYVDQVVAAAGVKIFAPDLEKVIPGSPLDVLTNFEEDKKALEEQFKDVLFEGQESGVILKADSLGSVEAIVDLFKKESIPIKSAGVGKIVRQDLLTASVVGKENLYHGVVIGFNVGITDDAKDESKNLDVPILWSNIIYKLVEDYTEWKKTTMQKEKEESLSNLPWPAKIKLLAGYCFRVSKPAIFGVEVLGGVLKNKYQLMKSGEVVGVIKGIQHEKKPVEEATEGMQLALSVEGPYYGKDIKEGDILYSYMYGEQIKTWEKQLSLLSKEEREIFEEIKKQVKRTF
ncbi:MAG TPA: translation initiation factor IF-2 [Candidatus Bilamarchaeaceae archaeon]|nr:translation initiation factor IF-2 [Candidatus Bilamarchaeaceae archaeon]